MQQIEEIKILRKLSDEIEVKGWQSRKRKIVIMTKSCTLIIMNNATYVDEGYATYRRTEKIAIDSKVTIVKNCEIAKTNLHGIYAIEEDFREVRNLAAPAVID